MSTEIARVEQRSAAPLPTPAEAAAIAPSPEQAIEYARRCATSLASVLGPAGMTVDVGGGRKHVRVEGWQTLGAMTGHSARIVWCREYDHAERGSGWEARAEVLDGLGNVVGAGEGMCLRTEKRWEKADEFAVRSMAQTRAISRALSSVLRHVVVLAGYQGTPAEELPQEPAAQRARRQAPGQRPVEDPAQAEKRRRWQELRDSGLDDHDLASLLTGSGIPNSEALLDDAAFQRAKELVDQAVGARLAREQQDAASEAPEEGARGPYGEGEHA